MSDSLPAVTLSSQELAALARELALDIQERDKILATHGLSVEQLEALQGNDFFRNMLEQEIKNWQSTMGTPDRIKLEAAAMFEKFMPIIYARITNTGEGLRDVMEGAKLIAKVAGLDNANREDRVAGEKFSIQINIGSLQDPPTVDVIAEPVKVLIP